MVTVYGAIASCSPGLQASAERCLFIVCVRLSLSTSVPRLGTISMSCSRQACDANIRRLSSDQYERAKLRRYQSTNFRPTLASETWIKSCVMSATFAQNLTEWQDNSPPP